MFFSSSYLLHYPYLIEDLGLDYRQGPVEQLSGHLDNDALYVLAGMLAIVGLHYGVGTDRLPRGLHEIAPYQTVRPWRNSRYLIIVPALMHPWGKANIARQMLYAVEPSQISQFAQYATGDDSPDTGDTSEQHVILPVMYLIVPPELGRDIAELLVDETEETHSTFQSSLCGRVFKNHVVQPLSVPVAPMVVIKLLGLLYPEIQ